MSIVSKNYTGNGSTKIFSSDFKVPSESHIEVTVDGVLVSKSDYDLINNAAVFSVAPDDGTAVVVRVGTTPDDLLTSTTNIDSVAQNLTAINTLEDNLAAIDTVATNIASVNTNTDNIADINTVAVIGASGLQGIVDNLGNITTTAGIYTQIQEVAGISNAVVDVSTYGPSFETIQNDVIPNLDDILDASDSALTALAAKNAAETAATNASTSETNASTSATNSANSATASATSASQSATSATNSANSATASATSASQSASSATASASSATASATSLSNFESQYISSPTEPTSPIIGLLWFDEASDTMKVYDGSGFVNAGSSVNGTTERQVYTATQDQTTFNATYDAGYVDVYVNGLKLQDTVDFTATNGSSVVMTSGLNDGDIVDIIAYGTFSLADMYTKAQADSLLDDKINTTDVGSTVQAYSANTVIDASYVHTDNNYTTTEKNKVTLATISQQESSSGSTITNILKVTQAEYDALTPVADTFYIIVG